MSEDGWDQQRGADFGTVGGGSATGGARRLGAGFVPSLSMLWTLLVLPGCFDSTLRFEPKGDLVKASDDEFALPDNGPTDDTVPEVTDPSRGAPFTITRVDPAQGSTQGGFEVRIVGSALTEGARVFFGQWPADGASIRRAGSNELFVTVPPGRVGTFDVTVELPSGSVRKIADAFTYHGLSVQPATGPPNGGTLIEVTVDGPLLERVQLLVGDAPCLDVEVVSPRRLRCQTPPGVRGPADLTLVDLVNDDWSISAPKAFTYALGEKSVYGGLRGGPIAGNVDITVVDSLLQLALPGARVVVVDSAGERLSGVTDNTGKLTVSRPGLVGPLTIHVALDCFESTSIVRFDARQVGVNLNPTRELRCIEDLELELEEQEGEGSGGGGGGGGRGIGISGSRVMGRLLFAGENEFGENGWEVIPPPRPGEIRVVYVYATRATVFSGNVDPSRGDSIQRIVEGGTLADTQFGVSYSIFTRPAGLAVYALGGIEQTATGRFTPYVMGVRRNVVTSPGVTTRGIDIPMSIPLDRAVLVAMSDHVTGTERGPLEYRASLYMDLGGEGFISRVVNGVSLDQRAQRNTDGLLSFYAQPAAVGPLVDLAYSILAGWYTGGYSDYPYTEALLEGVAPSARPVMVDSMLDIPKVVHPRAGEVLAAARTLEFSAAQPNPDFYLVKLSLGDGTPVWTHVLPGDERQVVLPDLSEFPEVQAFPSGRVFWTVRSLRVRGFEYDRFDYSALQSRNWTHDAVDQFFFEAP